MQTKEKHKNYKKKKINEIENHWERYIDAVEPYLLYVRTNYCAYILNLVVSLKCKL